MLFGTLFFTLLVVAVVADGEEKPSEKAEPASASNAERVWQAILAAGAISGAITSLFGLLSFLTRLICMQDLWVVIETAVQTLPAYIVAAVEWIGAAWHYVVQAYGDKIYPLIHRLTRFLPFVLPARAIDTFFILVFSLVSAWRIRKEGSYVFGEGIGWWRAYCMYLPFFLIAELGAAWIKLLDWMLAIVTFRKMRVYDAYDALPDGMDDFVFATLSVCVVLATCLGIDALYLAWPS